MHYRFECHILMSVLNIYKENIVMKKVCGLVVLGVALFAGVVFGGTKESKTVLVLNSPAVDAKLSKECFDFMKLNVRGSLRQDRTLLCVGGFGPEEQLKAFSAMRSERDALVVVLVSYDEPVGPVVIYSVSLGAAVVNIAPILADKELSEKMKPAVIERSAMYALGRLAGMDACLNPFCALSEYKQVNKNKMPGRNYCPNCIDRVAVKLEGLGVFEKENKR